jgi:hypothetical protein
VDSDRRLTGVSVRHLFFFDRSTWLLGDILLRGWCGSLQIDWVFLLLIQRDQEACRRCCRSERLGLRVGGPWEFGHRSGGFSCGRCSCRAPAPRLHAAADYSYLVGTGNGSFLHTKNGICRFMIDQLYCQLLAGRRWFWEAWFTRSCRSTRGPGRLKVCSDSYRLHLSTLA